MNSYLHLFRRLGFFQKTGSATLRFAVFVASLVMACSPVAHAQTTAQQPHVTAELVLEDASIVPGGTTNVALVLKMEKGWHTYWINPGDAGLPTSLKWTLPPGFTSTPLSFPVPERIAVSGLTNFAFEKRVILLASITAPVDLPLGEPVILSAKAEWLVCKEICLPGSGSFRLSLPVTGKAMPGKRDDIFKAGREALPTAAPDTVKIGARWDKEYILFSLSPDGGITKGITDLQIFPLDPLAVDFDVTPPPAPASDTALLVRLARPASAPKLERFAGVVSGKLNGKPFGWNFDVPILKEGETPGGAASAATPGIGTAAASTPPASPAGETSTNAPFKFEPTAGPHAAVTAAQESWLEQLWTGLNTRFPLLAAILTSFLGGIILNLMPCVLPVLSLKVLSLVKQAHNRAGAISQGLAYTAGVVVSFWVVFGVLLILRAAGNRVGWGFQLQSPIFVFGMCIVFLLLGLSLLGVFSIGDSLVGIDSKASRQGGWWGAFGAGALATAAATPCTAPLVGAVLPIAFTGPAINAMVIATALGLGVAAPYLLLAFAPGLIKFVPKPGAWMESFKQFLGFLLLATVVALLYVWGPLVSPTSDSTLVDASDPPAFVGALLVISFAAWVYGRWDAPSNSDSVRIGARMVAAAIFVLGIYWGVQLSLPSPEEPGATAAEGTSRPAARSTVLGGLEWIPYSSGKLAELRAAGTPLFLDFTAAWCPNCKVNERLTLAAPSVVQAFRDSKIVTMKVDYTKRSDEITKMIEGYGRVGIPLYVMYGPGVDAVPQVLPEVITPGIVLEAIGRVIVRTEEAPEKKAAILEMSPNAGTLAK